MRAWIVLYYRGGRFASFENTQANRAALMAQVHYVPMQTDVNGTEHWNVTLK